MKITNILNQLSLKEKIYQMFVLGFEDADSHKSLCNNVSDDLRKGRENIFEAINNNLGGIIFFAKNLNKRTYFQNLVHEMQKSAKIGLFTSIDQEGGLVERTICLDKKVRYLTQMALASSKNVATVKKHFQIMSADLKSLGINMNFAPVMDVNTNPNNPIIGIRAFSQSSDEVSLYSQSTIETFSQNGIIPVGKHFPGHGEAFVDSHKDLPEIFLPKNELEKIHIDPFKNAITKGLDAIMVAHVHFEAFDKEKIPASLSKNVIDYLRHDLGFEGLTISDDMVMGGIAKYYSPVTSCLKAIEAGINLFIFRNSDNETISMIEKLAEIAAQDKQLQEKINASVQKILEIKEKYNIINAQNNNLADFNTDKAQKAIEDIAFEVYSNQQKINLQKNREYLILSPNKSNIYNYSFDKSKISDFIEGENIRELNYPLNPSPQEIDKLLKQAKNYEEIVFVSYNAIFNEWQKLLFTRIDTPYALVCTGVPYDKGFLNAKCPILYSYGYNSTALKGIAKCFKLV